MRLYAARSRRKYLSVSLVVAALTGTAASITHAQNALPKAQNLPPVATPGQTPPISPNVRETPVPPVITIPGPPAQPADIPRRPLTANEAVLISLRYQPNITAARATIAAAQGRTQQIRSGLLPTLSLTAGYTNVQTISGGNGVGVGTTGTGVSTGTGGTGTGSTGTGTGTTGTGSTGAGTGTTTGGNNTGGTTGGGTTTGGSTGTTTGTGSTSGTTTGGGTTTTVSSAASGGGTSLTAAGFEATLNLRQLIFDFNHTRDLVRQASLQERAALENLSRVQSDLVFLVKQGFYLYVESQRLVTVNQDNVANRQSQRDLARARLNSGLGLPSDLVTAETALSEAITNLITARNNALLARINLALTMGIDPRTPIDTADSAEPPIATDDVQGLVATAIRQRPEILQAMALIDSARYGVNAARTTNAPSIAANLGVTSRGQDFPPNTDTFSVGVTLQFNIFDGGLTGGRVKEARANVDIAQAQLQSTQITVVSDVSQAYSTLRNSEQRVTSTGTEVANAQEGVRIAEGRFRTGLGLFLDIINAQAQLFTARTNQAIAQYGVDQARSALARAIGTAIPR